MQHHAGSNQFGCFVIEAKLFDLCMDRDRRVPIRGTLAIPFDEEDAANAHEVFDYGRH